MRYDFIKSSQGTDSSFNLFLTAVCRGCCINTVKSNLQLSIQSSTAGILKYYKILQM